MKKIKLKVNKPVYLGLPILEVSKTLMLEFCYDYVEPKYQNNAKLYYMDTDNFIINIKTEDVYEDIADDVEKRFDTSSCECNCTEFNRSLPIGQNKEVIGLMKDELGGKIMTESVAFRPKIYSYPINDCNTTIKKVKGKKRYVIKRILKFNDCKNCLLNNEVILKSQQRFKSEAHNVYTEEINNIALSCYDDKRLQTIDRVTSYPYGSSIGKVCNKKILRKCK